MMSINKGDTEFSGFCIGDGGGGGEFNAFINNVIGGGENTESTVELMNNADKGIKNNNNNNVISNHGRDKALKKGPWTAEEDGILMEYVRKHGEGNWNAVQRNSGLNRCGKSCRLRWANHLRPNLKKGSFTPQEERLIIELHAKMGNKWARMANLLPGRTDNEIKNYWNTRIKRHQRQGLSLYPPDIQPQQQNYQQDSYQFSPVPTAINSFDFQSSAIDAATQDSHHAYTSPSAFKVNVFPTLPLLDYSQQQQQQQQKQQNQYSNSTPNTQIPTPFTFQTQKNDDPSSSITSHIPPFSSSTSHNHIPTLALLDYSFPRPTPILQSPNRFKRFASCGDIANSTSVSTKTNNHTHHSHHFPVPHHSVSNVSTAPPRPSPHHHQYNISYLRNPCVYNNNKNLLSSSSSEFHQEIQKENEEMCSLLATMSPHPPLPCNMNYAVNVDANTQFDMNGKCDTDNNENNILLGNGGGTYGGLLEDLWQEANTNSGMHNNIKYFMQEDNEVVNGNLLPPNDQKNNIVKSTDDDDDEDLSKLIEDNETNHKFCGGNGASGDHQAGSNDLSSVVTTEDQVNFNLHHMFSFLPATTTTTDPDKPPLENCSWDNLPEIC